MIRLSQLFESRICYSALSGMDYKDYTDDYNLRCNAFKKH